MKRKIAGVLVLLLMVGSAPAWSLSGAFDSWIDEKATSQSYLTKAGGMALRGLNTIVSSPVELFVHGYQQGKQFDNGLGLLRGPVMGLFRTVEQVQRGAVDIVAAPVPGYQGIPDNHHHDLFGKKAA